MKLPSIQIADLLINANLPWVNSEHIYTSNVTSDEDTSGKTTFIRIQDTDNILELFGNNVVSAISVSAEIQIFFSTDGNTNILDAKVTVLNLLQRSGWLLKTVRPDTTDPDTKQKTVTIYVAKTLFIR